MFGFHFAELNHRDYRPLRGILCQRVLRHLEKDETVRPALAVPESLTTSQCPLWGSLQHDLLRRIFRYLSERDLRNAARMNKRWRQVTFAFPVVKDIPTHLHNLVYFDLRSLLFFSKPQLQMFIQSNPPGLNKCIESVLMSYSNEREHWRFRDLLGEVNYYRQHALIPHWPPTGE
jgi:hypothetical protein